MYIFELINKIIKNFGKKETFKEEEPDIAPLDDESNCSHLFFPLDSTKKVFGCSKCGIIKKIK